MDNSVDDAVDDAQKSQGQHVLVATLGLNPAPLRVSIAYHAPDVVILLGSAQSHALVDNGLAAWLQAQGYRHHALVVHDSDNWDESYEQAQLALSLALRYNRRVRRPRITVEPTFGTKIMAAGLILAFAGHGATWSYVTGLRDTRGFVRTDHETIRVFIDPVDSHARQSWWRLRDAWNAANWHEAHQLLHAMMSHRPPPLLQQLCTSWMALTEGLLLWQRCHYEPALLCLQQKLPQARDAAAQWDDMQAVQLLEQVALHNLPYLMHLVESRRAPAYVLPDLLSHAQRYAALAQYDRAHMYLRQWWQLAAESKDMRKLAPHVEEQLHALERSFTRDGLGSAQAPLYQALEVEIQRCCQRWQLAVVPTWPQWT